MVTAAEPATTSPLKGGCPVGGAGGGGDKGGSGGASSTLVNDTAPIAGSVSVVRFSIAVAALLFTSFEDSSFAMAVFCVAFLASMRTVSATLALATVTFTLEMSTAASDANVAATRSLAASSKSSTVPSTTALSTV